MNSFYNRECYDKLIEDINGKKLALVVGTPGIGKTMFLQRLLVHIVENVQAGETVPIIDYVTEMRNVVQTFRLLPDGSVIFGDCNNVDYELSDSVDIHHPSGTTLSIEVASDKELNYNTFDKRIAEAKSKGITTLMSVCTLKELRAMNNERSDGEGQFYFDVFGGSARNFCRESSGAVKAIRLVDETMSWFFGSECKLQYPAAWNSIVSVISGEFRKSKENEKYNVMNSLMRHRERGCAIWASKFMEVLGCTIFETKETYMYDLVARIFGNAGLGNAFEVAAHRKLSTSAENFELIPLHKKGARNVSREPVSFNFRLPVLKIRSVDDIGQLACNSYGLPVISNFPLVDAVVQPAVLLQMTVSEDHKGATNQLDSIRNQLLEKDKTKQKMVFVVPYENLKNFKYQQNLSSIQQFVVCPDKVIETKWGKRKRPSSAIV